MSLTRNIAQNTILQFVSKILGTILGLVSIGLITRYLGPEGFGYYTTIMVFLQFFGILLDFGLSLITGQMLGHSKWNESLLFANILSFRIITAIVFLGLAPLAVLFFPYPSFVKMAICFTTISFFLMSISQIFLGYYQKHLNLTYVAIAEIANRSFLLLAVILAVWLDWGLYSILISVILSNAIQLLILFFPAKLYGRVYLSIDLEIWKEIWQKTWPIAASIALNLLYLKTDIIFLSIFRPQEEVGLYGAAFKVIEVLATLPFILSGMLLPLLSQYWQTQQRDRFKELVQQGFDALSLFAWPLIIGTLFVAGDIMAIVAGEEFRSAGILLQLLIFASAVVYFNNVFAHAIVAINKQKSTIWVYALSAAIGLIGYITLIPKYGPIAAAGMTVITESLVAILIIAVYIRTTHLWPSFRRWIPALLSSGIMGLSLWLITEQHIFIKLPVAILVYSASLYLTKGVTREFIRDLLQLKR